MERADASLNNAQSTDSFGRSFEFLAGFARERAGLHLPASKAPMVKARVQRRMRALGHTTIEGYCNFLRESKNHNEGYELIKALTTNVTSFYREIHHFDFCRRKVLPNLLTSARKGERIRIWSAGCSSGEEPASIALDILSTCNDANKLDIKILATDINENVLKTARMGEYSTASLLPVIERHGAHVTEAIAHTSERKRISEEARSLIHHKRLNLMDQWPISGPFQIVFCRNVLIYFDLQTQNKLWPKFKSILGRGGYLFLGHSERIENPSIYGARTVATTGYRFG